MGKRHRKQHAQQAANNARARVEASLARGDSRGAVEAVKILLRETPGAETETLAARAYVARIRSLIAEGLGREAAAMAAIVRERFPAHAASHATELEDARLAAGIIAEISAGEYCRSPSGTVSSLPMRRLIDLMVRSG